MGRGIRHEMALGAVGRRCEFAGHGDRWRDGVRQRRLSVGQQHQSAEQHSGRVKECNHRVLLWREPLRMEGSGLLGAHLRFIAVIAKVARVRVGAPRCAHPRLARIFISHSFCYDLRRARLAASRDERVWTIRAREARLGLAETPPSPLCFGVPILFRLGRRVGAVLLIGVVALRLLAAEWHSAPDCRWSELPSVPAHAPGFTAVPPLTAGITFTNHLSEARALTNRNLLSGAGLALGDVNGDGRCDLFFCGLDAPDQLYLNLGGWKFTNVTASAFTGSSVRGSGGDSTGAAFADVDGDGDLDLLINGQGHGTRLFLNDGHGHFTDVTEAAGLRSRTGATSLALVDVDGDGDLDLYVANFRPTTVLDQPSAQYRIQTVNGKPQVAFFNGRSTTEADLTNRFVVQPNGQVEEYGQPDVLWRNDTVPGGPPTFTPISWTGGAFLDEQGQSLTEPPRDWGLACRF